MRDKLLEKNNRLSRKDLTFKSPDLQLEIQQFRFQQNLKEPSRNNLFATIRSNYPIKIDTLSTHLLLSTSVNGQNQKIPFKIIQDKQHNQQFYLKSTQLPKSHEDSYAILTIKKGVIPVRGKPNLQSQSKTATIPAINRLFKIEQVFTKILREPKTNKPFQVLSIKTNIPVNSEKLLKKLSIISIPNTTKAGINNRHLWQQPQTQINEQLRTGHKIKLQALKTHSLTTTTSHFYRFQNPTNHLLAVTINKGLTSTAGYPLPITQHYVVDTPSYPQELTFSHKGALLPLSENKRITVTSRGLPAVQYSIARIIPESLNQFITQTSGNFESPYFYHSYDFNVDNISQISSVIRQLNQQDKQSLQYASIDLDDYLKKHPYKLGLFLIKAQGWNPKYNTPLGPSQSRLVLITNMGGLIKQNDDNSRDVFVQSLLDGKPLKNVVIQVMAKNGTILLKKQTNSTGHIKLGNLSAYSHEKEPVALLMTKGQDTSFMPYSGYQGQLNYSWFATGGHYYSQKTKQLSAYGFTDRGLYRPGEKTHINFIVKHERFKEGFTLPENQIIPLMMKIVSSDGNTLHKKNFFL
ncbi:MAG: hypothetical protein MI743_11780, partial [Sneathiellales bacterium]|nr:hypothetical protein [Sneathiellales bacterium]